MTQARTLERILREAKRLRPVDRRKLIRALEKDQPQPRGEKRAGVLRVLRRHARGERLRALEASAGIE